MKLLLTPWSDWEALVCALALNPTCVDAQVTFLIADWWAVASDNSAKTILGWTLAPAEHPAEAGGQGAELTLSLQVRMCASSLSEATLLLSLHHLANCSFELHSIRGRKKLKLNIIIYGKALSCFSGEGGSSRTGAAEGNASSLALEDVMSKKKLRSAFWGLVFAHTEQGIHPALCWLTCF